MFVLEGKLRSYESARNEYGGDDLNPGYVGWGRYFKVLIDIGSCNPCFYDDNNHYCFIKPALTSSFKTDIAYVKFDIVEEHTLTLRKPTADDRISITDELETYYLSYEDHPLPVMNILPHLTGERLFEVYVMEDARQEFINAPYDYSYEF